MSAVDVSPVTLAQPYNQRRLTLTSDPYFSTAFIPAANSSGGGGGFFRWAFKFQRVCDSFSNFCG